MSQLSRPLAIAALLLLACSGTDRRGEEGTGGTGGTTGGTGGTTGGTGPACQSTADCAGTPLTPVCDPSSKKCVECLTDAQCPTAESCHHDMTCHGTKTCRTADDCEAAYTCASDSTCVLSPGRCTASSDCRDTVRKACDTSTLACVQCLQNNDCGGYGVGSCTSANTCQLNPGRCLSNADCTSGQDRTCDTTEHACVQCAQDSDCPSNICESHTCAALGTCRTAADCANVPGKRDCNSTTRQCVQCLANSECPGGTCQNGACVQNGGCQSDADCAGVSGKPYCATSSRTCVGCTTASQCGTGYVCTANSCVSGGTTDAGLNCNAIITCTNNCADSTCVQNCENQGAPDAKTAFVNLINCVFGTACPSSGGGVCDSTGASYGDGTSCGNCIAAAQQTSGACASQTQACNNN